DALPILLAAPGREQPQRAVRVPQPGPAGHRQQCGLRAGRAVSPGGAAAAACGARGGGGARRGQGARRDAGAGGGVRQAAARGLPAADLAGGRLVGPAPALTFARARSCALPRLLSIIVMIQSIAEKKSGTWIFRSTLVC